MLDKVLTGKLTFESLKPCDLSKCTKQEIRSYFVNSYELNDSLFTSLNDDSVFQRVPDTLRLPLMFYFGHTASVYVNKLILAEVLKPEDRINFGYETIFETGVDEMSWDDTENYRMGGKLRWPSLDEVIEYRHQVKQLVLKVIEETPLELPITMSSPWWGLFMGMEHERIHIETSSVLIRQLPVGMVTKPEGWIYAPASSGSDVGDNLMIESKACHVTLGKPVDFPSYGWDNEYGSLRCHVPAFEASTYPITNREFLKFVLDGGYEKPKYWSREGWQWVQFRQAKHPTFWVCDKGCKSGCGGDLRNYSHCGPEQRASNGVNGHHNGHGDGHSNGRSDNGMAAEDSHQQGGDQYRLRLMFDVVDMALDWPVEVNYLEAKAFCSWKGPGYRLPAEAEHHVMRGHLEPVDLRAESDIIFEDEIQANLNLKFGSSTPVNMYPANAAGFHDIQGNVWEWVEDHFNGLPGICHVHLYDDFASPCFDGVHTGMMGGSWVSTGDEASRFARFAFRRHFFQHLGFRVARTLHDAEQDGKVQLPIRTINTPIFVLGKGYQDADRVDLGRGEECLSVPTINTQYHYETTRHLEQTLHGEYSSSDCLDILDVCSELVQRHVKKRARAMHLGCATGRLTFGLTKLFEQVLGQDFCARFIDACLKLQENGHLTYNKPDGDAEELGAVVDATVARSKIIFKQLTWLPNEVGFFDFILASNLWRVNSVQAWMARMREVLRRDGLLAVRCHGDIVDTVKKCLGRHFKLVEDRHLAGSELSGNGDAMGSHLLVWKHA